MSVHQSPRDTRWFTVGDITLCCYCNRAIQLRRIKVRAIGECDVWVHFPHPRSYRLGSHHAQPKLSLWEADEQRYPAGLDDLLVNVTGRQPMRTVYLPGDEPEIGARA